MQKTPAYAGDSQRGQGRRRSVDLWFFRPALYRLSYLTSQTRSIRIRLAGTTGFEPATSGLTGRRTLQTVLRSRDLPEMPGVTWEVYRSGGGAQDEFGLGGGRVAAAASRHPLAEPRVGDTGLQSQSPVSRTQRRRGAHIMILLCQGAGGLWTGLGWVTPGGGQALIRSHGPPMGGWGRQVIMRTVGFHVSRFVWVRPVPRWSGG